MKRVGIDFHVFDGIFQGSRSHVLEIFIRVVVICPNIEFYIFLEKTEELRLNYPAFSLPNVHLVKMEHVNSIKRLCVVLPKMQRKYKLDLLHTQYVSPMPSFCKTIITLHDVLFESHPQYFSKLFVLRSKIMMYLSAKRSAHVFTVSEYSKKEIINRYNISKTEVSVIYNGVDQEKFYPGENGLSVIHDFGLSSKDYILTVGRLEPRKNHAVLLQAYAQLNTDCPLLIIGQKHFGYEHISSLITELEIGHKVFILESVSDKDLPAYYRHARMFVYPTWAEGFGMPVIEAMASGVPVITSNTTSLPEVVESAGILVEPSNANALAEAMNSVLNSHELSATLRAKGISQALKFNWDSSAKKVKVIYDQLLHCE